MQFADYFKNRANKYFELAKKLHNPQLAQTFRDRARLLTQAKRSSGRVNGAKRPSPGIVISQAKTLEDLKRELQGLPDTSSLCVPLLEYSRAQRDEFWRASPRLSRQYKCSAEFRPDGGLWFVKRP